MSLEFEAMLRCDGKHCLARMPVTLDIGDRVPVADGYAATLCIKPDFELPLGWWRVRGRYLCPACATNENAAGNH